MERPFMARHDGGVSLHRGQGDDVLVDESFAFVEERLVAGGGGRCPSRRIIGSRTGEEPRSKEVRFGGCGSFGIRGLDRTRQ